MATNTSLSAGPLRHRVRIERLEPERDSSGLVIQDPITGEVSNAWILQGERWARIRPVSGREFMQSAALQSAITAYITLRAGLDIRAKDRALHVRKGADPVIYDIEAVLPDPDSGLEYVTLTVSQGMNEG